MVVITVEMIRTRQQAANMKTTHPQKNIRAVSKCRRVLEAIARGVVQDRCERSVRVPYPSCDLRRVRQFNPI